MEIIQTMTLKQLKKKYKIRRIKMWEIKTFKTYEAQEKWIKANDHNHQIEIIYINNGYGVEYKKLIQF